MHQLFVLELLVLLLSFDCYGLLNKSENRQESLGTYKRIVRERTIRNASFVETSGVFNKLGLNDVNTRSEKSHVLPSNDSSQLTGIISATPELGRCDFKERGALVEKNKPLPCSDFSPIFSPIKSNPNPTVSERRIDKSKYENRMLEQKRKEELKPKKEAVLGVIKKDHIFSKSAGNLKESVKRLSEINTELGNGVECYLFIRYNKSRFFLQQRLDSYHKGQETSRNFPDLTLAQDLLRYHINALTYFCPVYEDNLKIFDYKKFDYKKYDRFYRKFCSQINICLPILVSCLKKEIIKSLVDKIREFPSVVSKDNEILKERNAFLENTLRALENEFPSLTKERNALLSKEGNNEILKKWNTF